MIKLIQMYLRIKVYKWLICRYRADAIQEMTTMKNLSESGSKEAARTSANEVARLMARERILTEKLEQI